MTSLSKKVIGVARLGWQSTSVRGGKQVIRTEGVKNFTTLHTSHDGMQTDGTLDSLTVGIRLLVTPN